MNNKNTDGESRPLDADVRYDLYLDGDLNQINKQRIFLEQRGFKLGQNNIYPIIKKDDIVNALKAIWLSKIDGWWNYKEKYIKYNICTDEDFKKWL